MIDARFLENYSDCREDFLRLADERHLRCTRYRLPAEESAELFQDYAFHKKDSPRLLIHFTGLHGVEGYIGSAVQRSVLRSYLYPERLASVDASVLFVHVVNPYGMAFFRRANPANVDLNRNCLKERERDINPDYAYFRAFLEPKNEAVLLAGLPLAWANYLRLGRARSVNALAAGQNRFPAGVFYAGEKLQPEITKLADFLRQHFPDVKEIFAMDLHSGLGEFGQEILFTDNEDGDTLRHWAEAVFERSTDRPDEEKGTYQSLGKFSDSLRAIFPSSRLYYVMQEFGTYSGFSVLDALRRENFYWQRRHRKGNERKLEEARRHLFECFFPADIGWRENALRLGVERFEQLFRSLEKR